MSLPLFLRGFVGLLLVFATTTYLITGSAWTTFTETVVVTVLVQIGYFAGVLFLVRQAARRQKREAGVAATEAAEPLLKGEQPAASVSHLPGAPSSPHS
jgi:exopolysaccharide production regulatory protein